MVAELLSGLMMLLGSSAELLHQRRCTRLAELVYGPGRRPRPWARLAPFLRVIALTGLCWALVTLLILPAKVHQAKQLADNEYRHIMLVLDVSPSMRLQDAGPSGTQSRMSRAADVMASFFQRVAVDQYKISVVAVYNGAKPVVVETTDIEVVRNILNDLPMHYAFKTGKTNIFAGLEEAARIARPWQPGSTTLVLVSDGDTVPGRGMPRMPASVSGVMVVGVGDPVSGKFIDGRQSRQDTSTLRQIALRLGGAYHNGNVQHLSSKLLQQMTLGAHAGPLLALGRREYALILCALCAGLLAFLPWMLHAWGSRWKPGRLLMNFVEEKTDQRRRQDAWTAKTRSHALVDGKTATR